MELIFNPKTSAKRCDLSLKSKQLSEVKTKSEAGGSSTSTECERKGDEEQ